MNELVREIEEDIRRERLDRLWHGFGRVMVAGSIAIVLATVGIVVYQNHARSVATEKTAELFKGIDRLNIEDFKSAVEIFDALARDRDSSYYGIAMLRKAQAQTALGDDEAARKTYDELAASRADTAPLARLLSYTLLPAPDTLFEVPDKGTPFYHSICEMRAWQLWEQGRKEQAAEQFLAIYTDESAPAGMRDRTGDVLQRLAPEKLAEAQKGSQEAEIKALFNDRFNAGETPHD
jgi:hypothetical protein